jgi:hypothetical protein
MKKIRKKLQLNKQVIAALSLEKVAGGRIKITVEQKTVMAATFCPCTVTRLDVCH